jgi:hypothetical protein
VASKKKKKKLFEVLSVFLLIPRNPITSSIIGILLPQKVSTVFINVPSETFIIGVGSCFVLSAARSLTRTSVLLMSGSISCSVARNRRAGAFRGEFVDDVTQTAHNSETSNTNADSDTSLLSVRVVSMEEISD